MTCFTMLMLNMYMLPNCERCNEPLEKRMVNCGRDLKLFLAVVMFYMLFSQLFKVMGISNIFVLSHGVMSCDFISYPLS